MRAAAPSHSCRHPRSWRAGACSCRPNRPSAVHIHGAGQERQAERCAALGGVCARARRQLGHSAPGCAPSSVRLLLWDFVRHFHELCSAWHLHSAWAGLGLDKSTSSRLGLPLDGPAYWPLPWEHVAARQLRRATAERRCTSVCTQRCPAGAAWRSLKAWMLLACCGSAGDYCYHRVATPMISPCRCRQQAWRRATPPDAHPGMRACSAAACVLTDLALPVWRVHQGLQHVPMHAEDGDRASSHGLVRGDEATAASAPGLFWRPVGCKLHPPGPDPARSTCPCRQQAWRHATAPDAHPGMRACRGAARAPTDLALPVCGVRVAEAASRPHAC